MASWIKKKKASIPRRIHLLFLVIVFLFVALILRLAQMQIYEKDFYKAKLTASTVYKVKSSMPRGTIFDRNGKVLVSNRIKDVVTYTRSPKASAKDIKALAHQLAAYISYPEAKVTVRAKKDYYLADPEAYAKTVQALAQKDKVDRFGNKLVEAQIYQNAAASLKETDLTYSDQELKVIAIFNQMNAAAVFSTVKLKTSALSEQDIAIIMANKSKLPGISVGTDWERQVEETSLAAIIGRVSSEEAGLPKEEAKAYLKKGYSLNDRVGTSYLEKQYEEVLQGKHEIREIKTSRSGEVISDKIVEKGQMGRNLKLSVPLDFQQGVEQILNQHFQTELKNGQAAYSEGIYAVALNPNTGAILAMAGLSHNPKTGELQKDALGTITDVFTPGSVVKGATLAAGWQAGVIQGNQVLIDQPIQFGGSQPINSWFTSGQHPITASQALEYSSNTYMVQVALRMMGQDYVTGMTLANTGMKETMKKLRAAYAEFGMGVATGVDLPGESSGYLIDQYNTANVLTEAFGQFDNYTTMQLAQYVSTIANGGSRLAPHIVEGIYQDNDQSGPGKLSKAIETTLLNKVHLAADSLAIIQDGFYQVVNSGSGYATGRALAGGPVTISAKTGTAETYAKDKNGQALSTFNLNVVAYGPSASPQIAVAVMYPHATDSLAKAHQYVAKDIINLYMKMYKNQ
ncbi:penicillin-binding protein PBP2B [Streptococcus equi subsp. equi]|uniref:penicillin-binding protein PBP2B n=1 Tax=Streptococcus equi TaxID=1336 RepID=UPI00294B4D2C|nr:penicillin-binding protein PBP2B [Streptococcus equi]WOK45209.1 penicillin-binding protein PBP2B [Streptococcus equi subsp. equi]WOK47074.1 penicillin-binding protein PBP2B [Streptococcus equi subsp. equi]WOK48979.1 penicillin-binding protein PBP2B [Streptococcus equi subsp. equi]